MAMSESSVTQTVQVADALTFGVVASAVYTGYVAGSGAVPWDYCAAVAITVALFVSFFWRAGLYDFETVVAWPRRMLTLVLLLGLVFVLVLGLAFALKVSGQFSRVWAFATFAASAAAMVGVRGVGRLVLRRWARSGRLRRRLAVYGAGRQADAFIDRILAERAPWQDVVGIYDDRQRQRAAGARPVVGGLDDLVTAARDGAVDSVVVALPWSADERVARLINRLRELPVHVFLGADLVAYALPAHQAEVLSGVPVLKVVSAPLAGWRKVMKGLEDRLVAGVLVVCLAPLMALIALAIRLDSPGPVLFVQDRFGFNNRRIPVRKFRTMVHDRPPEEGVPQARRDDPRVTRVGRFLRRTSLDELPQLFNVLDGSMSLVGPRPHAVEHNEKYMALIAGYSARHNVKPGITGWAQVNGLRGETKTVDKMRARVACDIYYVEHWSLWFDLRILLRTLVIAWRQSTAY